MAEVLSQDEINALIEAYKATGSDGATSTGHDKQVRLYDFARPDKFSKDHLRSLNVIHSRHGASFAGALSSLLRVGTQVRLLALDQLTYQEYCASVPDGTLFAEVSLEPLNSTTIFEFNPLLVSTCVDLLAGGSAVSPVSSTEITEIDRAVIRPVLELALRKYAEAWETCVKLRPRIQAVSTESRTHQVLLPAEAVLVCGYEVSVGESVSMMSICIPATSIEAILPTLSLGKTLNTASRQSERATEMLRHAFEEVEVECSAVLGRTTLPLEDIVGLEEGDLIRLPTKSSGGLELWVEGVPAFTGSLGLSGKNLALKIIGPAEEPQS